MKNKKILRAFVVAFSMYSKIPMPRFDWDSDDMKYHLIFFPWIGLVIGAVEYLFFFLSGLLEMNQILHACIVCAIPLLLTGGFHVDGFMDTCDALHSYQDREKKLEILKDPHIGAFSVICLAIFGLLWMGFASEITWGAALNAFALSFAISRTLSGISVVTMPSAKKQGMLNVEANQSDKRVVKIALLVELLLLLGVAVWLSGYYAIGLLVGSGIAYAYYAYRSKKEFGGITGDLAGYFLSLAELLMLIAIVVLRWVLRMMPIVIQ